MSENTKAWLAYAAVAIFWGTTFLSIKIAIGSLGPFALAAFRHTTAGVLLLSYFLLRGYKLPPLKNLKTFATNGFLMLTMGNGIISWGMLYVDSGLAALICALTPIWIVAFNALTGHREYAGKLVISGFALCLAGQIFIFINHRNDFTGTNFTLGIIAVFVSNICWALGTVYSKNHQVKIHPLLGSSLQMIPGGLICAVIAYFRGEFINLHPANEAIYSLMYLVLFGSILAYGSYMYILKKLPATIVSTYAYANTIVAVFIGWLWLNEALTLPLMVAVTLTLTGVFLINYSMQRH